MKVDSAKVSSTEVSGASSTKKADEAKKAKDKKPGSATDILGAPAARAEISGKAKEAAQAKAVATATPEVREERIAALKQRIADGTYKVDSKAIADKLVDEHLASAAAGA